MAHEVFYIMVISQDKVSQHLINDPKISLKAKGLWVFLMLNKDKKITQDFISKNNSNGVDSVSTAIKELIKNGYLVRKRERDNGVFKGFIYSLNMIS